MVFRYGATLRWRRVCELGAFAATKPPLLDAGTVSTCGALGAFKRQLQTDWGGDGRPMLQLGWAWQGRMVDRCCVCCS
jgi:hypothetical protein